MPDTLPSNPFQILLLRDQETLSGTFIPDARVEITPTLRTSGLLTALPDDDLKRLLLLLTFVHPNGSVSPTLLELADTLQQSPRKTRAQMQRLERFVWQGKPLIQELVRESGLDAYCPSPHILGLQTRPANRLETPSARVLHSAGREAVIAHSRATYARPRQEVERDIALRNGWPWPVQSIAQQQETARRQAQQAALAPPTATPVSSALPTSNVPSMPTPSNPSGDSLTSLDVLRTQMRGWGVPAEIAEHLLERHDPARIRRQLDWLPYRNANSPSRLLVAAIEHDYEAPAALSAPQATAQDREALSLPPDGTQALPPASTTELPLP